MLSTIGIDRRNEEAVAFYRDHAGCGHDPDTESPEFGRLRGAMALADAESWAEAHGRGTESSTDEHARVLDAERALEAMQAAEPAVGTWAGQDSNPRHEG